MDNSESNDTRLPSLTPEERRQIYEEERRRLESSRMSPATPFSPAPPTGAAIRRRPLLIGAGVIVVLIALGWIGLAASTDDKGTGTPGSDSGVLDVQESLTPPTPSLQADNIALTAMQEDNDVLTVTANLALDHEATVLRVEGVSYPLAERKGTQYIFHNVKVPLLGRNNAKLVIPGEGLQRMYEAPFLIARDIQTIDEWRKYASPIDYKRLSKNADSQANAPIKGRGKLYQITEAYGITSGGINVTPKGYGYWDDNVRFTMDGTTEFVQDDVVAFYGYVVGNYSYETTAGWNLTVPMVKVVTMERG